MSTGPRRSGALEVAIVGGLLLLTNVGLWLGLNAGGGGGTADAPEQLRDVASKLASAGVKGEAARYYARYLEVSSVSDATRAQVGLALARLLKDEGRYEEALGYLYRVEAWAPGSPAAKEAAPLIVEALERLGHGQAAQTALSSRSRLDRKETPADGATVTEGAVVARIDGKPFTTADLDRAIDALPEGLRGQLRDPAARRQFLQQFVAQELLYQKALKRNLDKAPEVRRQLDEITRQVVIGRMIEDALQDRVRADDGDLRNFYQANQARFQGADGKPAPFEQVQEQVKQAYMMSKAQTVSQELLAQAQAAQEVQMFPEAIGGGNATAGDAGARDLPGAQAGDAGAGNAAGAGGSPEVGAAGGSGGPGGSR